MVEVLSGFGIPQDKIVDVIGVDGKTLRKHYTTELQRGAATVEAKLVGNLLKLASGSDGTALKWRSSKVSRIYFRADAAFAMPEVYEFLEAERIKYAIRLPAHQVPSRTGSACIRASASS